MQIAKRMSKIDASGIRKVFELGSKLKNPINLSIGQPDFDAPDLIKDYACEAIKEGFNKYTLSGGMPELKEKLLAKINKTKKTNLEDILITSGVSGALFLALLALADPNDEILIPDPYFVSYKHLVNLIGAKTVFIDTYPDFSLNKEILQKYISPKTKLLLLNSPSNPTGKVYSKEELSSIAEIARKYNITIISDEIYDAFVYDDEYHSISAIYENTIVIAGYSKTLGIPGWRLGYAAGPQKIIQEMIKLQQYTFVCAPSFAQKTLINAIDYDMTKEIDNYKIKRNIICNELSKNFDLEHSKGAFYCFPKVPQNFKSDEDFFKEALKHNILLIPGSVFSERNTHFRISFANSTENLRKGARILNKIVAG